MDKNTDRSGNELPRELVESFILGLRPEDILSVYTGPDGCMCGCQGSRRYNPEHRAEASLVRGYEVSESECSSRSISVVLNKFKKRLLTGARLDKGDVVYCRDYDRGRQYVMYIRQSYSLWRFKQSVIDCESP